MIRKRRHNIVHIGILVNMKAFCDGSNDDDATLVAAFLPKSINRCLQSI